MAHKTGELVLGFPERSCSRFGRFEAVLLAAKTRMCAMEGHLAKVAAQMAAMNVRMDRPKDWIARLDRRLDLTDA